MDAAKDWTVRIEIGEHDGRTRAVARLHTQDIQTMSGVGFARLAPTDRDIPEIGDEIAAARALADLGRRLLRSATQDIEQVSGSAAHLAL